MRKAKIITGTIAGSVTALAAAVALIGGFEGKSNVAYRDIVNVWTICYGETRNVSPGDIATNAECDAMLRSRVIQFERELDACMKPPVPVPVPTKIALVSWTYNMGSSAACKSTLVRKANAGDLRGACNELPRWNRAGGRVIRGLTNRRVTERELCLSGLA